MVILNPKNIERTTLNNPPMVVNNPFIPQAQAIEPSGLSLRIKIPNGNGIPKKNPMGNIIRKDISILMN